jgi:hypothetical protein
VLGSAVVVPRGDNDLRLGGSLVYAHDGLREKGLHGRGRLGGIVDIPAHNKGVGGFLPDQFLYLPERTTLLLSSVITIKVLPKVPITGMDNLHIVFLFPFSRYSFRVAKLFIPFDKYCQFNPRRKTMQK